MLIPEKFLILQRSSEKTVLFVCLFFNLNSVCIVSNEETKMPKRRREKDHRKFSFLCRKDFFPQSHWWNLKTRKVFTCTMENGKWKEELSVSLLLVGRPSQYTEGRERESQKYDVLASLSAVVLGSYSEFQFHFQMSDNRFSDKFGEKATTWGSVLGTDLT